MEPDIRQIIASARPLPPKRLVMGSSWAEWTETSPGKFRIATHGATSEDEYIVRSTLQSELKNFGYTPDIIKFAEVADPTDILDRGSMDMPDKNSQDYKKIERRLQNRNKIESEAQHMAQNGFVTSVAYNTAQQVKGRVQSWTRPKSYVTTVWRNDPYSDVVQGFDCECEWGTFCRDRAPQYRWLQDIPCKHAIALNLVSGTLKITDLDGQIIGPSPNEVKELFEGIVPEGPAGKKPPTEPGGPEGGPSPGAGGGPGGGAGGEAPSLFAQPAQDALPEGRIPTVPRGPEGLEQKTPYKPEDVGAIDPNEILEQTYKIPTPISPADARDLTQEELEALEQTQRPELAMEGNPVENNPIQMLNLNGLPESPYNRYKREQKEIERRENNDGNGASTPHAGNPDNSHNNPFDGSYIKWTKVQLKEAVPGRVINSEHFSSNNWVDVPSGAIGLIVEAQDALTGLVEAEFRGKSGKQIRIWLEPEQLAKI